VPALDLFGQVLGHVVAQVVEAQLGVRAVDHVARVGALLLVVGLHVLQDSDAHAKRLVDRTHPFRVATGEVVVDRDDVHALAFGSATRAAVRAGGVHRRGIAAGGVQAIADLLVDRLLFDGVGVDRGVRVNQVGVIGEV
jgi:hypothetical protein